MPSSSKPEVVIIADASALTELCGVSLLERWRRHLRQNRIPQATVLSDVPTLIADHYARQSWRREDVVLEIRQCETSNLTIGQLKEHMDSAASAPALVIFARFCCDGRLLNGLLEAARDSVLIDSAPPEIVRPLWQNADACSPCAALLSREWLQAAPETKLLDALHSNQFAKVDAARVDAYVRSMRRTIRPVYFPAPHNELRSLAEHILIEATQKGALDFPAWIHSPIEKWIVSHLCRTSITPNQVTLFAGLIGILVTCCYLSGWLLPGVILALIFGVLDGVDGKLARLKIQTTKAGQGEHVLDYLIEMSWWFALAFHFHRTGEVPYAFALWLVLYLSHASERIARGMVQKKIGRSLDDFQPIDRAIRFIAARRNIYTWMFTAFFILGAPANGFIALCLWGLLCGAIRVGRSFQVSLGLTTAVQEKIAGAPRA